MSSINTDEKVNVKTNVEELDGEILLGYCDFSFW